MLKVIIFDVGGVYMSGSSVNFINQSYKILGINKKISNSNGITFDANYNKGLIDYVDCFKNFFKVPISEEKMKEIVEAWTTTWAPTKEMLDLVKILKKRYVLAILSNSDLLNSVKYKEQGWYSYFKHLILSHEIGIIKPDKLIYKIALDKISAQANECIFIDDQEKVLIPAKKLGMKTILFQSVDQLKKELKQNGIKF
ncbi:MAG TPA: HAD family phosphatase [Candidatus Magasanikbacteria bacterium]|nr:HAD family phosphatase [Candidatus Magasanikbacteria bacterium]